MSGQWNTVETHLLFDYYGALLTERQQKVLSMRLFDDLSLAEVAQELEISRQAVHDLVHRTIDQLQGYEERLHLIASERRRLKLLDELIDQLKSEFRVTEEVAGVLRELMRS